MNESEIDEKKEKLKTYFPVLIFIVFIFLLEALQIEKATALLISVMISLLSFGFLSAQIRNKFGDLPELKQITMLFGILTVVFIFILGVVIMHWYQFGHINLRWGLFFLATLSYFILLFRSLHKLRDVRHKLESQRKSKSN